MTAKTSKMVYPLDLGILPGLCLTAAVAVIGLWSSEWIGTELLGFDKSPISGIMMAIIAGLLIELFRESLVRTPHGEEISFAIRLSLMTATVSSVMAMLVAVPVSYLLSRYSFFGKTMLDTLLDLPIVLLPWWLVVNSILKVCRRYVSSLLKFANP